MPKIESDLESIELDDEAQNEKLKEQEKNKEAAKEKERIKEEMAEASSMVTHIY